MNDWKEFFQIFPIGLILLSLEFLLIVLLVIFKCEWRKKRKTKSNWKFHKMILGPPPDWRLWKSPRAIFINFNYLSGSMQPFSTTAGMSVTRLVVWNNNLRFVKNYQSYCNNYCKTMFFVDISYLSIIETIKCTFSCGFTVAACHRCPRNCS